MTAIDPDAATNQRPRPATRSTDPFAVLFDMDGLLIDSEPVWFEAESEVMARLGGSWAPGDQQALLGGSLERSVAYLLRRAAHPVPSDTVATWLLDGVTARVRERGVRLLPGARELVTEVAAAGVPHALVTSSRRPFVDAVLSATGLVFPVIVAGDDVRFSKPDPEIYLLAARKLGMRPGRCVALEDSATGVAAAEAAGCGVVVAVPSLAPIPPGRRRVVVDSLQSLDLAWLRDMAAAATPSTLD